MNSFPFKAALFDMDGVIIDNQAYHIQAWMKFSKVHNFPLDLDHYYKNFNGKTNQDLFKQIFGTLTPERFHELTEEKEYLYRESYKDHVQPLEGLIKFLEKLKNQKIKMAIGTSAPKSNIDFIFNKINIRSYFDTIVDGSMVKKGKPDPEIYLLCAEKLKEDPKNCVVFEDAFLGIEAGFRAGCHVIGVATTHTEEELRPKTKEIIKNFLNF